VICNSGRGSYLALICLMQINCGCFEVCNRLDKARVVVSFKGATFLSIKSMEHFDQSEEIAAQTRCGAAPPQLSCRDEA
jgi:hypothetical protein